jgi:hypothetical protein
MGAFSDNRLRLQFGDSSPWFRWVCEQHAKAAETPLGQREHALLTVRMGGIEQTYKMILVSADYAGGRVCLDSEWIPV